MEMEHGTDFVNQVVNLLTLKSQGAVIVLVHEGKGFHMLSNCDDLIHKRGMLESAIDVVKQVHSVTEEELQSVREEAERNAVAINKKGEVN